MTEGLDPITNDADVLDSRDVIARIEYLRSVREDETPNLDLDEDEAEELRILEALASEAGDYAPDWAYGETLIRDTYFETFAQELAEDIGAVDPNAGWPAYCIDWERAARDLQMDYTAVDFDGVMYWVR